MTAIDRPFRRPASPVVLPLVASVGSPWDEWSTVTLPVVDVRRLDPATVAFPVVGGPVVGGAITAVPESIADRRPAVLPVGTVPPRPRAVRIPAPRAGSPMSTAPVGGCRHDA